MVHTWCVHACACVHVFVCVWGGGVRVPYGAVVFAAISNREVAGSIPDDYGHICLSSFCHTPLDFSFILLRGCQHPVHAGVCGVMYVPENMKKTKK